MSTTRIIYEATSRKFLEFTSIAEYIKSYQAAFDKVISLFTDFSLYTQFNIKVYFQAIMLMVIGSNYSALVFLI